MLSVRCLTVCLSVLSVTLVYCGQTVSRIKMKLGMQVGLGPGHNVLDGDPAPPLPKGGEDPNFWPISVAAKWRVWLITTSDHIGLRGTTSEHIGQHRTTWERIEPLWTMPSAENCWYSSCVIEAQTRWARFCGTVRLYRELPISACLGCRELP